MYTLIASLIFFAYNLPFLKIPLHFSASVVMLQEPRYYNSFAPQPSSAL